MAWKCDFKTEQKNATGNHGSQNNAPTPSTEAGCAVIQGGKQSGHETFFPGDQELMTTLRAAHADVAPSFRAALLAYGNDWLRTNDEQEDVPG
jgi:hypothetical protein